MAKATKPRANASRSTSRREEIRRTLPRKSQAVTRLIQKPEFASASILLLVLAALLSTLVVHVRETRLPQIDRILRTTHVNRIDYSVQDEAATEALRDAARTESPRVYRSNTAALTRLSSALEGLPQLVRGRETLEDVDPAVRDEYQLTEDAFGALRTIAETDATSVAWTGPVQELIETLRRRRPIVAASELQAFVEAPRRLLLIDSGAEVSLESRVLALRPEDTEDERLDREDVASLVREARFSSAVVDVIVNRILREPAATILLDEVQTTSRATRAAELVAPVVVTRRKGDVIAVRGDRFSAEQYAMLLDEREAWAGNAPPLAQWLPRLGAAGIVTGLLLFTGLFIVVGYGRIVENRMRLATLGALIAGMAGLACLVAVQVPELVLPASIAASLIVAIVTLLAYDNRLALFVSAVEASILTIALGESIGFAIVLTAGCGTVIVALREVRHRNSIIRAGLLTAIVLAIATGVREMLVMPAVDGVVVHVLSQAAWSAAASMTTAFLMLGLLPSLERAADITTGMTLAELRDPSRPLLRELQMRAPGTYNHSLQVATIAEAAADAIGADSLLLYVGALYHDIGKMNKPHYFVENQSDGLNRHDKLRPAMSLLVIIGHVKDGIELAKEYGLPRSIQHFIEAHHGTTLVEYFYHAAREEAEADENVTVDEVEYRYPGPKPRTKEAAILMLSDAVESATRAMSEPHPARIESLVRSMSRKRLLDGQFDECDLTFRDLHQIEEAMIARLCAIYHGRIKYPKKDDTKGDGDTKTFDPRERKPKTTVVATGTGPSVVSAPADGPTTGPVDGGGSRGDGRSGDAAARTGFGTTPRPGDTGTFPKPA